MKLPKYTYKEVIEYWQKRKIDSTEKLKTVLDSFSILFAYNSGKIENSEITYHDTREIFENGKVINFTGDLRTLYEITNQKHCFEFLIDKIIAKEPISEEFIKKIHKLLTKGTYDERRYLVNEERPGEYKKHDYVTGRNEVGSSAADVQLDIQNLVEEVTSVSKSDTESVIKIASYFHNVIEEVHPFADDNGRLGRTLTNYILMINNLPPLIVYDEDKKYYYAALEKFDEEDDLSPMIEFFKYEMEKTWEKSLDKENGIVKENSKLTNYLVENENS